jgi:hypothetical protein
MHLVTPVPNKCPHLSVHCAGDLSFCIQHDLTARLTVSCTLHSCQHTAARHITELLWQFIHWSPSYSHCHRAVRDTNIPESVPNPLYLYCSPTLHEFGKILQHHLNILRFHLRFKTCVFNMLNSATSWSPPSVSLHRSCAIAAQSTLL